MGTKIATVVRLALAGLMLAGLSACGATVGSQSDLGTSKLTNGSPVTLHIKDADKEGTANGTGPARYTSVTEGGIQTFQTGSTPRDLYAAILPDGTIKFNLSSGTDINAKGVEFDPATKTFKVAEFGTSSSEPLRAGNEALDRLVTYWRTRDEASREVILAQVEAIKVAAPEFASLLLKAFGVP